jgi:Cu/Ag efflux pump CusA
MMRFIIKQSLRFRFVVVAIAATMMLFGIGALRKMPVDVFPEFAPPRVQIQTACLGLTASEVYCRTWKCRGRRARGTLASG